jgi:hypothetical protein
MKMRTEGVGGCAILKAWRLGAVAAMLLLAGWLATPAEALRREDPLASLNSAQRRVFQNYTRLYCLQFFRFEDRFVLLPNYQRSRENSTGRSYDQAFEEMTTYEVHRLGTKTKILPPAAEVIVSAKVIPAIDVGHYGFVNSVVIKEIVGPSEMIIGNIELIPKGEVGTKNNSVRKAAAERQKQYNNQTYRLLGFSTKDLKAGDKYFGPRKKGLQVAVMSTDPKHAFVMVNYDKLKRVRTNEFHEALSYVQIEPLSFIEMVRDNREKLTTEGDKVSLITIYRRFYNRYRPKRLSSTTRPTPRPEPEPQPEPEPEPEPVDVEDPTPEPEPEPEPRPEPEPEPEPEDEEEEDDWDYEEDTESAPDKPTFFGIPL